MYLSRPVQPHSRKKISGHVSTYTLLIIFYKKKLCLCSRAMTLISLDIQRAIGAWLKEFQAFLFRIVILLR